MTPIINPIAASRQIVRTSKISIVVSALAQSNCSPCASIIALRRSTRSASTPKKGAPTIVGAEQQKADGAGPGDGVRQVQGQPAEHDPLDPHAVQREEVSKQEKTVVAAGQRACEHRNHAS